MGQLCNHRDASARFECSDEAGDTVGSAAGISVEAMNGVCGASNAYVLAFSLSLQHELTSKGIRVQAVLPGRTATDGWDVAGFPWQKMPPEIVMPPEDMVDAALVGLDQGELVTAEGIGRNSLRRHRWLWPFVDGRPSPCL
jgi:short-subunit dehydrogenase